MENIYLQIDTTSEQAKRLLEYLKNLEFIRVIEEEEKIPLIEQIKEGLTDVKHGNVRPLSELINELQHDE
jgi:hypothetical protein